MAKAKSKTLPKKSNAWTKPKWTYVEEIQQKIMKYFDECFDIEYRKVKQYRVLKQKDWSEVIEEYYKVKEKQVCITPPTVTGLAYALDTNRQTLLNYEDIESIPKKVPKDQRQQFVDTIKKAKSFVERYNEERLHKWWSPIGPMFNLKVNFKRQDVQKIDHTTDGDKITSVTFTTSLPAPDATESVA